MSVPLVLNYPHDARTLEPHRLRAIEIWKLAEEFRLQIGSPFTPALDLADMVARSKTMRVNGTNIGTHWEFTPSLIDEHGKPCLGSIEYDPEVPGMALIGLNREALDDANELTRSTAAHELGHAVFDVPAWMRQAAKTHGAPLRVKYRLVRPALPRMRREDWPEWRANAFMGALLVPRLLLHKRLLRLATELRIPRTRSSQTLPRIHGRHAGPDRVQLLADELAFIFGVSIEFMERRITDYELIDHQAD